MLCVELISTTPELCRAGDCLARLWREVRLDMDKHLDDRRTMIPESRRVCEIPPFIVMDVLERAKELERGGRSIIHLEVGEPDFRTPEPIREACRRALSAGETGYTPSLGIPELRGAIAEFYSRRYGIEVSPQRVIVTPGSSPALMLVFAALLDPGDEVIISDPCYACYPNYIRASEGVPVRVKVPAENGFRFVPGELASHITAGTKAILINSPANPTGNLLTGEDLRALADLGVPVVSDEIYQGLVYEGHAHSILEFTDRAFVISGFSKTYAMTGWRLGYAIVPGEFVRPIQKLQQNLLICAGSFTQRAALAAFSDECRPYIEEMVRTYDARRRYILPRLKEIGLSVAVEPTGAFYVLADARKYSRNSYDLAFRILEECGVAVAPGIDFGPNAEGYLRFSYASSLENIREGLSRLEGFLAQLTRRD
ncbi:MAG: pyridoxal phosphate-dependent aminotransferase [Bacillota bacterium]